MNAFDELVAEARAIASDNGLQVAVSEPLTRTGRWFLSLQGDNDYAVEVEWSRHLGFGVAAGSDLTFGSGVDEIYGSVAATAERIRELADRRETTSGVSPYRLAELRKISGVMQTEAASRLSMSKSGLAQMESAPNVSGMKVQTLKKVVASFGGELIVTARFPEGRERQIAID